MTSCAGMLSVTVRKSIRTARSRIGITKITPGPRNGFRRPSRKTTARSYSLSTLRPLSNTIAAITITIPTPLTIGIPPYTRRRLRGVQVNDSSPRSTLRQARRARRRFGPHRDFESAYRHDNALVEAIVTGHQPPELTAKALTERIELPLLWNEQERAV